MSEDEIFWLVWNENRGLPKHKHRSEHEAFREAGRLALQHPGERFHVLRSLATAQCAKPVQWTEHTEIPF